MSAVPRAGQPGKMIVAQHRYTNLKSVLDTASIATVDIQKSGLHGHTMSKCQALFLADALASSSSEIKLTQAQK